MARSPQGILRYPLETIPDYMILTPSRYKNRLDFKASGPAAGPPIILPIPELPGMRSSQSYGQLSGALNNLLAGGLGLAYDEINNSVSSGGDASAKISEIADRLKQNATNATGPVLRELAAGVAGSIVNISAQNLQAFATGQVSSPQTELLYGGPTLRSYAMQWTFAPKSEAEAIAVYKIIQSLKQQHSATALKGNGRSTAGMLRVPNVFDIKIMIGGKEAEFYQKFFTCAMESISVQQDNTGSHITLPNGAPAVSSMSITMRELRPLYSGDFEENI